MRALIQRVKKASVEVDGKITGAIPEGLLILLGIEDADGQEDIDWLVRKISQMRIFPDENGAMNKSMLDVQGRALVVSQFTLHASTKKGNRPSFIRAAKPDVAIPLYENFVEKMESQIGSKVETGIFGADMSVDLINWGPVTIWVDSKERE
jgi:D-tyrosyl-tRNA(Tyr) deacylase